jgi:hypothetical protein
MNVFRAEKDFDPFRRVIEETLRAAPMRICAHAFRLAVAATVRPGDE